jgi:hypothetical protein
MEEKEYCKLSQHGVVSLTRSNIGAPVRYWQMTRLPDLNRLGRLQPQLRLFFEFKRNYPANPQIPNSSIGNIEH